MPDSTAIIIAAAIASVPPSVMAGLAFVSSLRTRRELAVANGDTPGQLADKTYVVATNLELRFNEHILDRDLHRNEGDKT